MDRNLLWDVFCETGDIEVYLKYKEQKKEGEEKVEACKCDRPYNERDKVWRQ